MNLSRLSNQSKLTHRESEIVQMLVQGNSTKDISRHLNISMDTVKTHRKNIHRKLGTHSVVQLMLKVQTIH